MTLAEIRTQLAEESGRFDLVSNTSSVPYDDNGADYYIKAGQRTLDNKLPTPKSLAEVEKTISAGDFSVRDPMIQAVKSVWLHEDGEKPEELKKLDLREFYSKHGDPNYLQTASKSRPEHYTLGVLRDSTPDAADEEDRYILIGPPSDGEYTLLMLCTYFSAALDNDDAESFWSIKYPHLLVIAARYMIEVSHRNTSGQQDFLRYIQREVDQIDDNVVEEQISNRDQLRDERGIFEGHDRSPGTPFREV